MAPGTDSRLHALRVGRAYPVVSTTIAFYFWDIVHFTRVRQSGVNDGINSGVLEVRRLSAQHARLESTYTLGYTREKKGQDLGCGLVKRLSLVFCDQPRMSANHPEIIQFLYYAINSILFHRNVYTREEFDIAPKFGQTQYVVAEYSVRSYIDAFLVQVDEWIEAKAITHLALVILAKDDGRTLERWTFDITSKGTPSLVTAGPSIKTPSSNQAIASKYDPQSPSPSASDIAVPNVLKQIVAATTSLPDLLSPGVFTLQAYVHSEATAGLGGSQVEVASGLMDDWRDVTEEGQVPFVEGVETQQTFLRGVKTRECDVNLVLTALDD